MTRTVILKLGKGQLYSGFPNIIIQILQQDKDKDKFSPIQLNGSLPPNSDLVNLYQNWLKYYNLIGLRCYTRKYQQTVPELEFEEEGITQFSDLEFEKLCQHLKENINNWLASSEFNRVEKVLRTKLNCSDVIRLILETEDELLRKIPWHLWQFFEDFPLAEISLGCQEYEKVNPIKSHSSHRVRILAILGNSQGIDLAKDQELLNNLPHAEIKFLVEPNRQELDQYLWEKEGWDILFFAGHSYTEKNSSVGYLQLSSQKVISLKHLKNALKTAISNGLNLAIFNSCDGLGLAKQLHEVNIPQLIVMREPVPDVVAQEFLKNFLINFAEGKSFYQSFREGREKLEGLEDDFPCASWLPVICQNPAINPPLWQDYYTNNCKKFRFSQPLIFSSVFLTVGLLVGGINLFLLKSHEPENIIEIIKDENNSDIPVEELSPQEIEEHFNKQ
jgi:hypothetical protein